MRTATGACSAAMPGKTATSEAEDPEEELALTIKQNGGCDSFPPAGQEESFEREKKSNTVLASRPVRAARNHCRSPGGGWLAMNDDEWEVLSSLIQTKLRDATEKKERRHRIDQNPLAKRRLAAGYEIENRPLFRHCASGQETFLDRTPQKLTQYGSAPTGRIATLQ